MKNWKTSFQRGMVSGACASVLSSIVLAACGRHEAGSVFAPTNAISHWLWGDKAARRDAPSLRYTATGYLIHHASATFWAVLFERVLNKQLDRRDLPVTMAAASGAAAVACFTDYQLTPRRLRPGYEARLSRPALAAVYATFALGLAAGAMISRNSNPPLP